MFDICCTCIATKHLIVAEHYTSSFSADPIPMLGYFITVAIICYISSADIYAAHAVLLSCLNVASNRS